MDSHTPVQPRETGAPAHQRDGTNYMSEGHTTVPRMASDPIEEKQQADSMEPVTVESTTPARIPDVTLYRFKPGWGLPSLSIACMQLEAFLRLAKMQFVVKECAWSSFSPTGHVPAIETRDGQLVGSDCSDSILGELEHAKAIISYLQQKPISNLDGDLSRTPKADLLAFTVHVETKLIPALLFSCWCETEAYCKVTQAAFGAGLAFPLSYLLPLSLRHGVRRKLVPATSPAEVYQEACKVLDALSSKLECASEGGSFFFGKKPSSLDALVFACLAYIRSSSAIHPELKKALEVRPILHQYVLRIEEDYFGAEFPHVAASADVKWLEWKEFGTTRTDGAGANSSNKQKTVKQKELEQKGRWWLVGAVAAIAAYVGLSGKYAEFHQYLGELGEDDDGESDEY